MEKSIELLNEVLALKSGPADSRPTIFLAINSNVISCGLRETVVFLCKHKLVDAVVCSGGGIEEDLMKTKYASHVQDFVVNDKEWRLKGKYRIGNMVVSQFSYMWLEDFFTPLMGKLHDEIVEYQDGGMKDPEFKYPTPSSVVKRTAEEMIKTGNYPESFNF
jgi:deoxyhypusine synthase